MSISQTELEPVLFQATSVSITFNSHDIQSWMVICVSRVVNTTVMFAGLYL